MMTAKFAQALDSRGIHYGWVMVAVTFVTMLATAAAMGLPGVLLVPLKQEFGWSTAEISGALALRLVMFGLMGPFAAALMHRYGLRTTIIAALFLIVTGLSLATRMTSLWELWVIWGLVVGLGTGMTAIVLGATVASNWFESRRGLVLGLLTASAASGQLASLPLAAWLTQTFGWRSAMLPAIFACAFAALLMLLFGADRPQSLGLLPYGPANGAGTRNAQPDEAWRAVPATGAVRLAMTTLVDAAGSPMFWMLFFTFGVCGFTTNGLVQAHFIPLCVDLGIPELGGAEILAVMGVFDFIGTIASGWLADRYDSRRLLFLYYAVRGTALLLLPTASFTVAGVSVFAIVYGLEWIATVPPTVKLAVNVAGADRAPMVFGWIFTAHQLGAAIAAFGAGMVRDSLSSYLPAFVAGGMLCFVAAVAAVRTRLATDQPRRPMSLPTLA